MTAQYLRIAPDRIGWLTFLLQGYDGLWLLSTIDADQGLVRIIGDPRTFADLYRLLADLSPTLTGDRAIPQMTGQRTGRPGS